MKGQKRIELFAINGTIIDIKYTTYLGVRYDERYREEVCVYLLEMTRKKVLYEYHCERPRVTEVANITDKDIEAVKKEIEEYNDDFEECDNSDCVCHIGKDKKGATPKININFPMYG